MGATPASLLDLIARGGSMQVGIDQNKERALTEAALANAVQSKAAAKELEAQTAKHNAELEAFNQAQADNQVISDAFAHVGGNRSMMDKYIKANASGAGVMRWQMENEKLREQASKASAADLDRAEKVHKVMGSSLGYLNDVPDEQLQAEYAKVAPQIQQLDPSINLPPQIDRMGLKRIMGQLTFADEILKSQKEQAEIEGRRQQTEAATKDAALKERGAFLQAIRPDMPSEEYAAVRAAFPSAAKSFPAAPGQWMKAATQEAVKVGDRAKVEQEARVLSGMSPTGITAEQQARIDQDKEEARQRERQHRESLGVQMRGQNMTNDRAMEARESRPVTEAESKTYGYYKRMNDAEQTISAMAGKMAEKGLFGQTAMKYAPNWLQSEDNQVFEQASRQFTEARLRRDSGAAIPTHEYDNDKRMYFPQPGDTPETQKRKDKARAVVLDTMKKEAGRAIERFDGVKVGAGDAGGGGSFEHFAVDGKGHQIGSRGNKWYDVKTGKEIQ